MSGNAKGSDGGQSHRRLRVLVVEDSKLDAALLLRALERGGFQPCSEIVETAQDLDAALAAKQWDLILADHSMPNFSAPAALELVKKRNLDLPFIIVSGHIDEETAVAAMQAGAHDYIMKERLARLVPAVERELREATIRRAQRRSEEELRRAHEELETRVEKRTADLKAANIKLHNLLEERRRLENELLEIAENERRRIGFDLHDDLGQKLTGLLLMLKSLEQRLAAERHSCTDDARKVRTLVEQILRHTHDLARHFSSMDVTGDDLTGVLKGLASNVTKMFELRCGFNVKGAIPPLPEHTTMQFYKIAQEAVSNAIKHGKAREIQIVLSSENGVLTLAIQDDGIGIQSTAASPKKKGMGLQVMKYRAGIIGGSIDVRKSEHGTRVTCTLSRH